METFYIVYTKVIGGEWKLLRDARGEVKYALMEQALGMAETLRSPIKEVTVTRVTLERVTLDDADSQVWKKTYELVDC